MREKTCCFTGHRELPFWARRRIASNLEKAIVTKIDEGIRFFGAGGARGFDALAARTVLRLKKKYPDIKLILVLPCLMQTRGWRTEDVEEYEHIKAQADKVVYVPMRTGGPRVQLHQGLHGGAGRIGLHGGGSGGGQEIVHGFHAGAQKGHEESGAKIC